MEATRQKYETHVHRDEKGNISETGESHGPVEKFEFGAPDDNITAVVGGSYMPQWSPDFFQKELGRTDGVCARFYYDKKVALDVGDPNSKLSKRKRELLFQNGMAYLCIPENFSRELDPLKNLYQSSLAEYFAYEKLHPRPVVTQPVTFLDSDNKLKTANMRAVDVKVGGGMLGSFSEQDADFKAAQELTGKDAELAKENSRTMKAIRKARESGQPFRNPFIGKGKRKYSIEYAK